MNDTLTVRKIKNKEDLQKALSIRRIVFVEEQNCPPDLEWMHDNESVHFLALYNHIPCGTCRWRKTENGYKLERFAVLIQYRHKGVGRAMVAVALSDLPNDAGYVYLNAQLEAVGLYSRFGFIAEGLAFEEAGIQHIKMTRKS